MKVFVFVLLLLVFLVSFGCTTKVSEDDSLKCISEIGKAYYPGTEKCCNGLKSVFPYELPDGTCINPKEDTRAGAPICAPCGNGKCEKEYSEDKCNCPEDCK